MILEQAAVKIRHALPTLLPGVKERQREKQLRAAAKGTGGATITAALPELLPAMTANERQKALEAAAAMSSPARKKKIQTIAPYRDEPELPWG